MEHQAALRDRIGFQRGLDSVGLDAADKLQALFLPEIEVAVALVVAVHDPGLAGRQELRSQGAFIADLAQEYRASLIVMGSHGKSGLLRLLMGRVTERVIGLTPCPVLVVKE
jgi:nucleotide-binding universal stress UspA family protein